MFSMDQLSTMVSATVTSAAVTAAQMQLRPRPSTPRKAVNLTITIVPFSDDRTD